MRKRILIVEGADAVRGVAESVLRQNGYEVIAVSSGDKAKEVLQYARPDLIVLGGSMKSADQTPLYEKYRNDPKTSSIPMVLFAPVEPTDLPFPPEVIVARPVDPKDFLQKVKTFSGYGEMRTPRPAPTSSSSMDDEFLDAALGLDHLDVTDSEVLDKTSTGFKVPTSTTISRGTQIGHDDQDQSEQNESRRVETLMIHDEQTDIMRKSGRVATSQGAKPPAGTSKLEIMSDQYGMNDPDAFKAERPESSQHDYDWFVSSMRDELTGQKPAHPASPTQKTTESQKLSLSTTASMLDPHTPGPSTKVESKSVPEPRATQRGAEVEKFIDEFKREIEVLKSIEPDPSPISAETVTTSAPQDKLAWEESVENVTPQQVELFSRQLAKELGERIAEKIVSKIDSEKLLQLIKGEIIARQRRGAS
jgi:CheY-like chemotaxis protein